MNHLRFLLAFLVVLGSYGMSSGQDQQRPPQQSQQPQYAREWTGLIPGYQQPAGVEPQHGVMIEVRASRNLRPSDVQFMTQAPVRASKQVVRKIPVLGQTGVKPMAGEKPVQQPAPTQINPQNLYPPFTALLPKPEPHDLIMHCGVQGRSADVIAGRCM
jgi:hypothetical protein